ncbi:hypothetical protein [Collinsella aerofaciens]|uniref:hypothetical protein n=1 Tax=Collinsella aerofaciens TaxID=74426 RepID=UPI00319DC443
MEAEGKREQGWTDLKADAEKSVSDAVERADAASKAATKAIADVKAAEAKLYPVAENTLKGTAKDTFIHVDDAFPSSLLGIEIEGATEQTTTTGKNLLNPEPLKNESNFDTSQSGEGFYVYEFEAPSAGDYTVSVKQAVKYANYLMVSDKPTFRAGNQTWFSHLTAVGGATSATFKNVNAIYLYFSTSIAAIQATLEKVGWIQIEKGSTATAYEPYTGGKPSPSHEYPQEISNISKVELKVAGKNLADVNESNSVNFILHKEPLPAGTYTFSCDKGRSSGFMFNVKPIDASGHRVEKDIAGGTTSPCTITITEPMGLFVSGWGLTAPYGIGSIQLEAGSKATDFEPTSKPKATQIDLKGNELCSLVENLDWNPKTFKDELVIDSGGNVSLIKRVFTAHIDGSEPIWTSNTDKFQYFNYTPKTVRPIDGSNAIRSNRFGKVSREPWNFYVAGGSNAALFFTFPLGTFANADELNEWLSKNPIDVNYLGVESQTIPLGKIEPPALPESVSNVWTDAGVTPRTGIEYTRDVNIVVANLESAIASIS